MYTPSTNLLTGETMGLLLAINLNRELGHKDDIFELDAKCVVDASNSTNSAISNLVAWLTIVRFVFLSLITTLMLSLVEGMLTRLLTL